MSETPSPGILPGILEWLIKVFDELREPQQNEILFVTQEEARCACITEVGTLGIVALPCRCHQVPGSPVRCGQGVGQGAEQQNQPPSSVSD